MSRRRSAPPDSLELLLDTLCNTFGGILFIALLVVILLQLIGGGTPVAVELRSNDEELAERVAATRAEIRVLEAIVERHGQLVGPNTAAEAAELVQALDQIAARKDRAERERENARNELQEHQSDAERAETELRELEARSQELRQALDEARRRLQAEREQRSRAIGTPTLHETSRTPLACELRYGRYYITHEYNVIGERIGPNLEDYYILEDRSDALRISPRPTGGVLAEDSPAFRDQLRKKLDRFPPTTYYMDMIVRTDSFAEFHILREVLAELGYEVSILPCSPSAPIVDRGGKSRGVQ